MSKAHTQIPWKFQTHALNEPDAGHGIVFNAGGAHRRVFIEDVGMLETVDVNVPKLEANARLIVRAVNSHAAMVKALDGAPVKRLDESLIEFMGRYQEWYRTQRHNALKLAKEGE